MEGLTMGITLLTFIAVIELALAIYSLATKSHQRKTRAVLHRIEFAVFVFLLLALVIQWSFRWYGLAALLFGWSAVSVYQLRKDLNKEYRARNRIGQFVTASFLALLAISLALVFPQREPLPPTGPYLVATARYSYTDTSRIEQYANSGENRKVNVVFWYPQSTGGNEIYPLVVFSHGGLGTETSNESLYLELASHGYVVCSIGHPYHAFWTTSEDGQTTFVSQEYFGEIMREDASHDKEQSFRYYQRWLETRTADINFVIDTILAKTAEEADGVYTLVDRSSIGVMGHSLGGSAALAIPRLRGDIAGVIALESPFLGDIVGVENGAFAWTDEMYPTPVLNIYSDSSWNHLSEWPQYAENAVMLSNATSFSFVLHLPGAGHFSLTDLALASPLLTAFLEGGAAKVSPEQYLREENEACLLFFDRYLKNHNTMVRSN